MTSRGPYIAAGYGRKTKRKLRGGAWYNDLWDGIKSAANVVNDIAKKTGIISKVAKATGNPEVAGVTGALGYGRRRRRRVRRVRRVRVAGGAVRKRKLHRKIF